MAGDLFITDGTTTIDLKTGLFRLVDWTPVTPPTKGEGVWQDSMLDDGRRLAMTKRGNARETFSLKVHDADMDGTIRETQELRRLLEKARAYWTTNWQREPVWIEARGSCETNKRYAYVMDYSAERDDNPYISPFYGEVLATMDEWTLEIERSDWLANPPGDGTCVQLSSLQAYSTGTDTDKVAPTQLEDDIHVITSTGTSNNATAAQILGSNLAVDPVEIYGSGIRFRGLAVPAGATIVNAILSVTASNNDSGNTVFTRIYGELNAAPAVFANGAAGYVDFVGRALTANSEYYSTRDAWTAGTAYLIASGAGFVEVLQEIIDLPGWAAGNNLAILIYDAGSYSYRRYSSFDGANDPELYVEWETGEGTRGRSATCTNEVYFANKHNLAQLTDAYYYDAAPPGYTDIMAAALPAALFPVLPAAGDILYLGINSTLVNSGPFASVIFDIGTAANDIINVDWEYWNGAWVNLTTTRTIDSAVPAEFFNVTGVGSVSFVQPADWTTNDPGMGITGYWIRCVIPAGGVGAAPTAPTQANRLLYTVVRPSVDIDELQVAGDVSALARMYVRDYTDDYHASAVVLATRSLERGSNFRMYLNASDEQNIPGILFTNLVDVSIQANTSSPAGRCAYYNPGAGGTGAAYWYLDSSVAPDFFGKYRAYLRVDRNSAVVDCTVSLSVGFLAPDMFSMTFTYRSEYKTIASGQPDYLIDFGVVDIPGFGALRVDEDIQTVLLQLRLANTTTTPQLYIYDLILIPVDEWAGEFMGSDPSQYVEKIGVFYPPTPTTESGIYLDVDSLNLKQRVGAVLRSMEGDILQFSWKDITTAVAQLQANKDQQVFAMLKTWYVTDSVWLLPVEGIGTLDIDASARYLSMRGDR